MSLGLFGKKLGMTQIFDENGNNVNSKKHEPEPLTKFTVYESNPNQTFSTNKYLTYTHVQFPANFKLSQRLSISSLLRSIFIVSSIVNVLISFDISLTASSMQLISKLKSVLLN